MIFLTPDECTSLRCRSTQRRCRASRRPPVHQQGTGRLEHHYIIHAPSTQAPTGGRARGSPHRYHTLLNCSVMRPSRLGNDPMVSSQHLFPHTSAIF